jgi:hypothetical protein
MSVAFTKESDAEAVAADLPDRPIPAHPNLVTARGLARIEAELSAARAAYAAAQAGDQISSDRTAMARATRDLRYWSARRASAQLVEPRTSADSWPASCTSARTTLTRGSICTLRAGRRRVGTVICSPARSKASHTW